MVDAASIWKPPLVKLTLGLTLVVVATAFEALAVATILPQVTAELGGLQWYGWTFSAFLLANVVGITVGGDASDRRGPALPFGAGMTLFAGGLVVSGTAPSMHVLVAGRIAQGLGAGLLSSVGYASIARVYSPSQQPRMLATLSSAWVIPGLMGPGLSGLVTGTLGWRWVFLGLAPLPLLAGLLVLPGLRTQRGSLQAPSGRSRVWSAVQVALGVSAALLGLGQHAWTFALPLVAAGAALSVPALRRLMPRGTLSAQPGLAAAIATVGLLCFTFFGTEAFLPLALSQVRGAAITLTGLALTSAALCWTAGAWLPVRLVHVPRSIIITAGVILLGAGICLVLALLSPSAPPETAVLAWALAGLGMGLAFTSASAAILEAAPAGSEGAASAALQLAQVLGAGLATGIAGVIVAAPFAGDPPAVGLACIDLLMLAVAALALLAARRVPNARARESR